MAKKPSRGKKKKTQEVVTIVTPDNFKPGPASRSLSSENSKFTVTKHFDYDLLATNTTLTLNNSWA